MKKRYLTYSVLMVLAVTGAGLATAFFDTGNVAKSAVTVQVTDIQPVVTEITPDKPMTTTTPTAILAEPIKESTTAVTPFTDTDFELSVGKCSDNVLRLKKFLIAKGYTGLTEDFFYDSKTKDAVTNYQSKNKLDADGIVFTATYKAINDDMTANNIVIPKVNVSCTGEVPSGTWILINKSSNQLYYMIDNKVDSVYHVATGKTAKLTPEGQFTVVIKAIDPIWGGDGYAEPIEGGTPNNPLGPRWLGLSVGGGGNYGIHGNANPESIGTNASHGCVRMDNTKVTELYEKVETGTPVWIGSSSKLEGFGIKIN